MRQSKRCAALSWELSERFDPYRKTFADPKRGKRIYIEHPMDLKTVGHISEIRGNLSRQRIPKIWCRTLLRNEGYPTTIPVVRSSLRVE